MAWLGATAMLAGLLAAAAALAPTTALADDQKLDADFAQRMFAGSVPNPKAYACFARHYDAEHMAQHPLQKVSVMKLLISTEKDPDFPNFQYAFRIGVAFRDRPGNFDSSGNCGHAPTIKDPDNSDISPEDRVTKPAGIDFECDVDCDGGGVNVALANSDNAIILKLDRIRIWKSNAPDAEAVGALQVGADDKVFRLDRTGLNECASLVADRRRRCAESVKSDRAAMEDPMRRRNLLQLAFAIMPMADFVQPARAATPDAAKVVYHLSDLDKVSFVLGNIRNHFDGMGGPEHVTIALVVHGPALKAFHIEEAAPATAHDVEDLRKTGLGLNACIHTMAGQHVTLKDLLPGFTVAEKGGVVKLAELQARGYAYLRP